MAARQSQVDAALQRAFARAPPEGKVRAAVVAGAAGGHMLVLYLYQHEILRWRLPTAEGAAPVVSKTWWEKPTDKRILDAALAALGEDYSTWPVLEEDIAAQRLLYESFKKKRQHPAPPLPL